MTHKHSIELLSHFQCGSCNKLWSISDAPDGASWHCPWCGHKDQVEAHQLSLIDGWKKFAKEYQKVIDHHS